MNFRYTRRRFSTLLGGSGLALSMASHSPFIGARARAHIVIIGGGPAGLGVARRLTKDKQLQVSLVEPQQTYSSCFSSNLVLTGLRRPDYIQHHYGSKILETGVRHIRLRAVDVDDSKRKVILADGSHLPFDRLVVAPGISFQTEAIEGYDTAAMTRMPHAYRGGKQLANLQSQLKAMPDGGLFIIAPPVNPFRCPPAPYERASLVAEYFQRHKPKSKILIIDAKNKHSKQSLFQEGWDRFYPDMIEWLPAEMTGGGIRSIDAKKMMVRTEDEEFKAEVINLIPAQRAAQVAHQFGLTDQTGWCPVNPMTLNSMQRNQVYVVGDSIHPGDMPKSAFAALSQAHVCAAAIIADLRELPPPVPAYASVCWSYLRSGHAVKVGADYEVSKGEIRRIHPFISDLDENDDLRAKQAREAVDWYDRTIRSLFVKM